MVFFPHSVKIYGGFSIQFRRFVKTVFGGERILRKDKTGDIPVDFLIHSPAYKNGAFNFYRTGKAVRYKQDHGL
jgi:hypothetical protein